MSYKVKTQNFAGDYSSREHKSIADFVTHAFSRGWDGSHLTTDEKLDELVDSFGELLEVLFENKTISEDQFKQVMFLTVENVEIEEVK